MTLAPEHGVGNYDCRKGSGKLLKKNIQTIGRERMADVKRYQSIHWCLAEHPFTKEPIPVWIGDYVLAGRNRAVMAVPCGDVHAY
jgi:leucyl-tRNA synthetase